MNSFGLLKNLTLLDIAFQKHPWESRKQYLQCAVVIIYSCCRIMQCKYLIISACSRGVLCECVMLILSFSDRVMWVEVVSIYA